MPDNVADFAAQIERGVRAVRQGGDPAAIAAAGRAAVTAIRERATDGADEDRAALLTAKRLAYNAAADCWPGWEPGPAVAQAVLEAARELAVQSAGLVAALRLPPVQAGNAAWLIGAFDLALGRHDAARAQFAAAEGSFAAADAPDMALMAAGYVLIAREAAGIATGGLEPIIGALRARGGEDGPALADQLITARAIFAATPAPTAESCRGS